MVYQFWIPFVIIWIIIIYFDRRFGTLRDNSLANPQPYSWARVQLSWWTVIILSSFIAIVWKDIQDHPPGNIPTLHYSTLVLLGISAATITTARVIDVSDQTNPAIVRHQDSGGQNFILDILSDQNGISIHRFQAVIFNAVFGIWFLSTVVYNLTHDPCSLYTAASAMANDCKLHPTDYIMPVISDNNLILLGLSAATYAAIKTAENKSLPQTSAVATTVNSTGAAGTTITTTSSTVTPAPTVNPQQNG